MSDAPSGTRPRCAALEIEVARERAAAYAAGALESPLREDFETHLETGCPFCEEEVRLHRETLAAEVFSAPARPPAPGLKARLLGSIREKAGSPEPPQAPGSHSSKNLQLFKSWKGDGIDPAGFYILRAAQGRWEEAAPGVRFKRLAVDDERGYVTMLVRMDEGTSYPPHHHAGAEECYVIEGDLRVGDQTLLPGDFQYAGEGSDHAVQSTEKGCLLLIVSSQSDELL